MTDTAYTATTLPPGYSMTASTLPPKPMILDFTKGQAREPDVFDELATACYKLARALRAFKESQA